MVYRLKLDAELNCLNTAKKKRVVEGVEKTIWSGQHSHTFNSKTWVSINFH